MITALMAQVDLRFPSFEDNYAVSVNSQILLIDTKPRDQSTLLFNSSKVTLSRLKFPWVAIGYAMS